MTHRYLEVTYRKGRPLAAYLYLPRHPGDRSSRSEKREGGMVVDYTEDGRAIGVEITAPRQISLALLNRVLAEAHAPPATADDVAPLMRMRRKSAAAGRRAG